jgi:hypothetical protein
MIEIWSRFIVWLFGDFVGVAAKDAWFIGRPVLLFGMPVWVGAVPVSGEGWALLGGLGAYIFVLYFGLQSVGASIFAYIALALPGIALFYRLAPAKTCWTTKEGLRALRRN